MPACLILKEGRTGTGKTTGWEVIPAKNAAIITPNSKDLPFKGGFTNYKEGENKFTTNNMLLVPKILEELDKRTNVNFILIDDFTHFMNARTTDPAFIARKNGGDAFAKWYEFAADVARIITGIAEKMRDDVFIVINGHTSQSEDGEWTLKTSGKMLESSLDIVSYFTYILHADVKIEDNKAEYYYLTNRIPGKEAKTPKGCFEDLTIPNNDLEVIKAIAKYQGKTLNL